MHRDLHLQTTDCVVKWWYALIGFSKLLFVESKLLYHSMQCTRTHCLETIAQSSRVLSLHELKHGTWRILCASQAIGGNGSIIICWFHMYVYICIYRYYRLFCTENGQGIISLYIIQHFILHHLKYQGSKKPFPRTGRLGRQWLVDPLIQKWRIIKDANCLIPETSQDVTVSLVSGAYCMGSTSLLSTTHPLHILDPNAHLLHSNFSAQVGISMEYVPISDHISIDPSAPMAARLGWNPPWELGLTSGRSWKLWVSWEHKLRIYQRKHGKCNGINVFFRKL